MPLSARNRLEREVVSIERAGLMAEVVLDVGGTEVGSSITASSVERLGLAVGDTVTAVVKASNVMVKN